MTIKCKSAPPPKTHKLAVIISVLLAVTVFFQIKEDNAEITDTFNYYGNMTTKAEFTYPDEISLWTFGSMTTDSRDVDFVIQLWCKPLGSTRAPELVETRINQLQNYTFSNQLPPTVSEKIIKSVAISGQIGQVDRIKLREQNEITPYNSWDFNNIIPLESSICHSVVQPNVYTQIFGIKKNATFTGHEFTYMYPDAD